jgi:hypothetical protein
VIWLGTALSPRPKPRGGSIPSRSERSRSQTVRNASTVTLSAKLSGRLSSHAR